MVAKENQPTLKRDIERLFERAGRDQESTRATGNPFRPSLVRAQGEAPQWNEQRDSSLDLGHGRLERRTLRVLEVPRGEAELWPHARQVWQIERRVQHFKKGTHSCEVEVGVTSLEREEADAQTLNQAIRAHWGIENRSHWIRDVVWEEDQCRVRTGTLPQALASIRNLSMALLRRIVPDNIAHATRKCAANPNRAFELLIEKSAPAIEKRTE